MFFWSIDKKKKKSFVSDSMGSISLFYESSRWQFHAMMGNETTDLGNLVCVAIKSFSCFCFREVPTSFFLWFCLFVCLDRSLAQIILLFFFKIARA